MSQCTMCDGTGRKDHAGFAMDPCDHVSPSADKNEARMTDTQKNAAVVQAAERLFDFASEHIPQPTPKAAQDFADPDNYWHRAASAALPTTEQSLAGEVVGWAGSGSLMALKDGREGFIWPTPAAAHSIALYATPQPAPVTGGEDAPDPFDDCLSIHVGANAKRLAALSPSAPEAPSERGVGDWHPRIGEEVRPSENMIERWPDWRDTRLWVVGVTLDRNVVGNPTRGLNVCVSDEWPVTNRTGGFTDGFYINRDHAPDDLVPLTRARKIGGAS